MVEGSRESPPRSRWGVRAPSPVSLRHPAISPSEPGPPLPTNTTRSNTAGHRSTDDALKELADGGGTASISPVIEAGLGIGHPATGRARAAGLPIGLGAPGGAGMEFTTRDVLRMATIEGAEVAGLGDVTGSLRPGKQADLVLLRTDTLATAPAHDPVAAIVLSADTGSVDTVLVGGRVVKRDGRLLHHDVAGVLSSLAESAAHVATSA